MFNLIRSCTVSILIFHACIGFADGQRLSYLYNQLIHATGYKVRLAAALEIGKIADGSVANHLLQAFEDEPNQAVRLAILEAMANIPSVAIFPPLLYLQSDAILTQEERRFIGEILLTHRDHLPVDMWESWALVSNQPRKRSLAAFGIAIGSTNPTHPWLLHLMQDPDPMVRKQAFLAALSVSKSNDATVCAHAKNHNDPWIANKAKQCLQGNPSSQPLQTIARIPLFETNPRVALEDIEQFFETQAIMWRQSAPKPYTPQPQKQHRDIDVVYYDAKPTTTMEALPQKQKAYPEKDQAMVTAKMNAVFSQMNHCYAKALSQKPTLKGELHFFIGLQASGHVARMEIQKNTLADPTCMTCMKEALKNVQFEKLTSDAFEATYRFTFTPPKKKKIEF
jgi:hypothetical protein